jgi:hypothetical protein
MDVPNIDLSLASIPEPKLNVSDTMRVVKIADTMRIFLQSSSPPPESTHERNMLAALRALYDAINALLDQEVAAEKHPIDKPPRLLRLFKMENNVGGFANIVDFACTPWQMMVNWRNCATHKERLAVMNLSDPRAEFKKMMLEACGQVTPGGDNTSGVRMSGGAIITGAVSQQPEKTPEATTLLHPKFEYHGPMTPTTLLSPATTGHVTSRDLTQPCALASSPYVETGSDSSVSKPPTPSSSPFRPGSAQEHLRNSRAHKMEGHMPYLPASMYRLSSNGAPWVNADSAVPGRNGYEEMQPFTAMSHYGPAPQWQTPHVSSESSHEDGNNDSAKFLAKHPTTRQQQYNSGGQAFDPPHFWFSSSSGAPAVAFTTFGPRNGAQVHPQAFDPPHFWYSSGSGTPAVSPATFGPQNKAQVHPQHMISSQLQNSRPYKVLAPNELHSRSVYHAGNQAQPQQWDRRPILDTHAEFQAVVNRQQPPALYMSGSLASAQSGQHGVLVPSKFQGGSGNQQQGPGVRPYPTLSNAKPNLPKVYTMAAAPPTPVCTKTKKEREYEQKLAVWQKRQAEQEKQKLISKDRRRRLRDELAAEMKQGNDVLLYRYRDYMEINPCSKDERMSPYHLDLLANQVVEQSDKSEEAMAVRYAKQSFYNQWKVKDRKMVIAMLREKRMKNKQGVFKEMKAGRHLITAADIHAIRQTAPSYTM